MSRVDNILPFYEQKSAVSYTYPAFYNLERVRLCAAQCANPWDRPFLSLTFIYCDTICRWACHPITHLPILDFTCCLNQIKVTNICLQGQHLAFGPSQTQFSFQEHRLANDIIQQSPYCFHFNDARMNSPRISKHEGYTTPIPNVDLSLCRLNWPEVPLN